MLNLKKNKILFVLIASFLVGCGKSYDKSPNHSVMPAADLSAQTVSEAAMNRAGCSFQSDNFEEGPVCNSTQTVMELYDQKLSIISYYQDSTDWHNSLSLNLKSGEVMNQLTHDSLFRKHMAVHALIRNLRGKNPLAFEAFGNLRSPHLKDPGKQLEGLEFLLHLSLATGSIAHVSNTNIQIDCSHCSKEAKQIMRSRLAEFEPFHPNSFTNAVSASVRKTIGDL